MKKIIMLLSAALIAISCSDSDSPAPATTSGPVTVTETRYNDVTGAITNKNVYEYQDGKLQTLYLYSPSTFDFPPTPIYLQTYQRYFYTEDGKLNDIRSYTPSGELNGGYVQYFYDSQQRLDKMLGNPGGSFDTGMLISYNNDGSISGEPIGPVGATPQTTWLLNADGYIYKQITDSSTYELVFDGPNTNAFTATDGNGNVKSYEFDTQHDPALTGIQPMFGSFQTNEIVGNGLLQDNETRVGNRFITKEFINGVVSLEYQLQFDTAGRLTSRKTFNPDGLMIAETIYEY